MFYRQHGLTAINNYVELLFLFFSSKITDELKLTSDYICISSQLQNPIIIYRVTI